tara:strand:+ start:787 stop:1521 length:735 start_codon:yes stop_codon:yes gene_type:complete
MQMIDRLFLKFFMFIINFIDQINKKKIILFFLEKLDKKKVNIVDIGAHKGETIDLFASKLNINKIYSFEPNEKLFQELKKNKRYKLNQIEIYNFAIGKFSEKKELNIFKDTSSSTINLIDENTKYFKRKKKLMAFFSGSENFIKEKQIIEVQNLSEFIKNKNINNIDILKIDTEGYEYNVLSGLKENDFKNIRFIYFEHHYDLMIKKQYKFNDINKLLLSNNFKQKFKVKMKFRKTFEYIYEKN